MKNHGLPDFSDLKTSTRTEMIYLNCKMDLQKIFKGVSLTNVKIPLTKKKKDVDKSLLKAPKGSIISIQKGVFIRGVDMRKKKKHWCAANCRLEKRNPKDPNLKPKRVLTVIEENHAIESHPDFPGLTDLIEIKYFCTNCKRHYTYKQIGKIPTFLNQVTIVVSIGNTIVNAMLFSDNIKIAGCKKETDSTETTLVLWQDHISKIPNSYTLKSGYTEPQFLIELVMRNVDVNIGFFIDKIRLNSLMNNDEYSDKVFMSSCESTGHTSVNIKMYSSKPVDFEYNCLVIPTKGEPYFKKMKENSFRDKKKKAKSMYTTFIVFSSSEIILTGRYEKNMREMYNFFIDVIMNNKSQIEEKIVTKPSIDLKSILGK